MLLSVCHFAMCLTFQPAGLLILLHCKLSSLPWIGFYSFSFPLSILYCKLGQISGRGWATQENGSSRVRWRVHSEAVWRVEEEQTDVDSILCPELKDMALSLSVHPIKSTFLSPNRASCSAEKQTGFHIGPL